MQSIGFEFGISLAQGGQMRLELCDAAGAEANHTFGLRAQPSARLPLLSATLRNCANLDPKQIRIGISFRELSAPEHPPSRYRLLMRPHQ